MFHQTAKPRSLPDLGQLDPGEEGVDRQLLHLEETMNLSPFKVICEKGVVVLSEEGDECCLISVASLCIVCVHIGNAPEISVRKRALGNSPMALSCQFQSSCFLHNFVLCPCSSSLLQELKPPVYFQRQINTVLECLLQNSFFCVKYVWL